ncbi:iron-containing alcohol dehydrogenase [Deinococcus pimensis]|uniref:iron-containing alcohol dehydrogenase n=1 Tax=Deinococcus pimensis TaxID=309888 RepID=UPI00047FB6B1|nr:iron-containing alcohol dehydrogenase [Deinococcus pimensis]
MHPFTFHNPTRLIFGRGQLSALEQEVPRGASVLLVYGGGSVKRPLAGGTSLYDGVLAHLSNVGATVTELSGVEPNPRLTTVRRGVDLCREHGVDLVLAVGGGSVIDCAKAVAVAAASDRDAWDLILDRSLVTGALPLGVVLTHAATGSEMNPISVITNWETSDKRGWSSPFAYPRFSILDPTFTLSVPRDQTAYGIVDMMSHVLEDYFDFTPNTPLQDRWSEGLLRTLVEVGPRLVADLSDLDLRETVMLCGTWAFNGVLSMGREGDWACHRIEHAISAVHDIPHGGGLSIIYPHWMEYVLEAHPARFAQLATNVFGVSALHRRDADVAREGVARLRAFWNSLGAPARLSHYGIGAEALPRIADLSTLRGETFGTVRPLGRDDALRVLERSL